MTDHLATARAFLADQFATGQLAVVPTASISALCDEVARLRAELAKAGEVDEAIKETVDGAHEAGRASALNIAYLLTKDPAWTVPRLKAAIAKAITAAEASAVAPLDGALRDCYALARAKMAREGRPGGWEDIVRFCESTGLKASPLRSIARDQPTGTVGELLATVPVGVTLWTATTGEAMRYVVADGRSYCQFWSTSRLRWCEAVLSHLDLSQPARRMSLGDYDPRDVSERGPL